MNNKENSTTIITQSTGSELDIFDNFEELLDVPESLKNEIQDYDYSREKPLQPNSLLNMCCICAINQDISYDYLSLKIDAKYFKEINLEVNRKCFFYSNSPKKQPTRDDSITRTFSNDPNVRYKYRSIQNSAEGEMSSTNSDNYPNCKLYHEFKYKCLGNINVYFYGGSLFISFSGKINAAKGYLGYINKETIRQALNHISKEEVITFDIEQFIKVADVICAHVVLDLDVSDLLAVLKSFSCYLPLRTLKYSVLMYQTGYEIILRRKNKPYGLAIYNKGVEARKYKNKLYEYTLGRDFVDNLNNIVRIELRLYKWEAIRDFLAPNLKDGTIKLEDAQNVTEQPIIKILKDLGIEKEKLLAARNRLIVNAGEQEPIKLAEFERMTGAIKLLEENDYDLDKVRSYLEVETGKKLPSNHLNDMCGRIQRYIECRKPRTIATLLSLVEALPY